MLDKLYNSINDYLSVNNINQLQNKNLISISNKLSQLDFNHISIPQLVTCGSQSAGKSSVINSILCLDILPTDSKMCSRCPVKLELTYHDSSNIIINIGSYEYSQFQSFKNFDLESITQENQNIIKNTIIQFQNQYAGDSLNISDKEIVIRISSNQMPNLTIIDLPGMISLTQEDKGQSATIVDDIKDLIKLYITQENTIILAIMPARVDLETDNSLAFIKQYDCDFNRTVGILTKVDLMNEKSHICDYLSNNISKSLQLGYGYFGIKFTPNVDLNQNKILEQTYFNQHCDYSKLSDKSKLGINNLVGFLSNILLDKIKSIIPSLQSDLNDKLKSVMSDLNKLGEFIEIDDNNKNFILNLVISNFCNDFKDALENNSCINNYGKELKKVFICYRSNLYNVNPLSSVNDSVLTNIIEESEGNKLFFQKSMIEILENCIVNKNIKSIQKLKNPSAECIEAIYILLITILNKITQDDQYNKYPELVKLITQKTVKLINDYKTICYIKLDELIDIEEAYIWTNSESFREKFKEIQNIEDCDLNKIKNVINIYFKTIVENFQNYIPKLIMLHMIKNVITNLSYKINQDIENQSIIDLLSENQEIAEKRKQLMNQKKSILDIKELIQQI